MRRGGSGGHCSVRKARVLFNRCDQDLDFLSVKHEGMSGFALATAQIILFKDGADCRVLNIGKEGLPIAGSAAAAVEIFSFITIGRHWKATYRASPV